LNTARLTTAGVTGATLVLRHPLSGSAVAKAPQSYPENAGPQSDWEVRRDDQQGDKSGPGHWKTERILSAGLLALIPAAIFVPGTAVDMAIAIVLPVHNHMGMDGLFTDYVKPRKFLPAVYAVNRGVGVATVAGLTYFNLYDVGICEGMKMLWSL
jgi:succinate dehydrogenase (ubiquinone) membrane anchor subunit